MNSLYVLIGAAGGAAVKVIFTGDYSMRSFLIGFASIILGSAATILIIHFVPTLGHEPIVVSSLSSIVTAVSSGIFRRIHAARVKANLFGFEAESDGEVYGTAPYPKKLQDDVDKSSV